MKALTHEFFGMGAVLPEPKEAVEFAARDLEKSFSATEHQFVREKK